VKLITRDTDYAVRALCYSAACPDKKLSVADVVKELKIPRPFLRKIVQILNKNGIVRSYKGKGGGFRLIKPPEKIFLVDLIKIFQGAFKLNECFFKQKICPNINKCPLNKKIDEIEKYISGELGAINIAFLIRSSDKHGKKKDNKNK
jgi:Rrf2 family protein